MIKEITNLFRTISSKHKMINTFSVGDIFDVQKTGNDLHVQLFLELPISIDYSNTSKSVSFSYYLSDIPSEKYDDQINILNRLELINDDILGYIALKEPSEFVFEISNINSLTLTEWMGDNCVAIKTDVTLKILRDLDNCLTPFI